MSNRGRVLQIPELLSIIFLHADRRRNAACATVCKQWLGPALNEIWRHIDDLSVVFRLLAPMHTIVSSPRSSRWLFSRFVLPSDWSRFEFYNHRIRSLHIPGDEFPFHLEIDNSVFAEVARTRPTLIILPKLRKLTWEATLLNQAILFMSHSVTHLIANIEGAFLAGEGFLKARAFLIDAAARLPNLVLLDLTASFSVRHVQEALLGLLGHATKLEKLVLPRYWLTSAVISQSARSPALKVAQWEYEGQGEGDRNDVEDFKVSACSGAFPALTDLSLEVCLPAATELIENPLFPDKLTTLFVDSLHLPSSSDIQRFLTACSTNCQSLAYLSLDLHCLPGANVLEPPRVTLETIDPILSCENLTKFMLVYTDPLAINDNDVHVIASRLPSLVEIYLNHEPTTLLAPPLSLAALLPFAQHCPRLEKLGLYINATSPIHHISDPPQFAKLSALHVGTSPIEAVDAVAPFISRLCAPLYPNSSTTKAIEINTTISWDPALIAVLKAEVLHQAHERSELWHGVHTYLPMVLATRAEERSRSAQLEDELKRLRSLLQKYPMTKS